MNCGRSCGSAVTLPEVIEVRRAKAMDVIEWVFLSILLPYMLDSRVEYSRRASPLLRSVHR